MRSLVRTPMGAVTFGVDSAPTCVSAHACTYPTVILPEGMAVDRVALFGADLRLDAGQTVGVTLTVDAAPGWTFSADPGEHLEAISAKGQMGHSVGCFALRDAPWHTRHTGLVLEAESVAQDAIAMTFRAVRPVTHIVQAAVAWALDPKSGLPDASPELSAWFAVDRAMSFN